MPDFVPVHRPAMDDVAVTLLAVDLFLEKVPDEVLNREDATSWASTDATWSGTWSRSAA